MPTRHSKNKAKIAKELAAGIVLDETAPGTKTEEEEERLEAYAVVLEQVNVTFGNIFVLVFKVVVSIWVISLIPLLILFFVLTALIGVGSAP